MLDIKDGQGLKTLPVLLDFTGESIPPISIGLPDRNLQRKYRHFEVADVNRNAAFSFILS
jgi:hypothetical protein